MHFKTFIIGARIQLQKYKVAVGKKLSAKLDVSGAHCFIALHLTYLKTGT